MPFNGSGGFDPIAAPNYPAVAGQPIYASQFNANMVDIFAGFGNCVTRDGQSPPTANLPMAGFKFTSLGDGAANGQALVYGQTTLASLAGGLTTSGASALQPQLGTVSLPSYSFLADLNTGMWSPGADSIAWSVGGTEKLRLNTSGFGIGATPSSGALLEVGGAMQVRSTAKLSFTDTLNAAYAYGSAANVLTFGTNSTDRFSFDASGNGSLLNGSMRVNTTLSANAAHSVSVNNVVVGYYGSRDGLVGSGGTLFGIRAESDLFFAAGGASERMRIMNTGPVVINATTNAGIGVGSDRLAVNGSIGLSGQFNASPPAAVEMVNRTAAGWDFYSNAGTVLAVQIQTTGHFVPGVDNTRTLGSSALRWATVFGTQFSDGATSTGSLLSSTAGAVFVGNGTGFTTINLNPGGVAGLQVDSSGKWGYPAGTGGTVTQATSKSTGVTLNKPTGEVVMNNQSLANATSVNFTLTNSFIGTNDLVLWSIKSGATGAAYFVETDATAAGSCRVHVTNRSASPLSEAIVLQFTVVKGTAS